MSLSIDKFCKSVREKTAQIAQNQLRNVSNAFNKASKTISQEEKLKDSLRPFVEKVFSSALDSEDELELKKYIVAAWISSDSNDEIVFTKAQLSSIVDQLITEIKTAQKLGADEISSTQKALGETENKYLAKIITLLKKFSDVAIRTAAGIGVSIAVTSLVSYLISPPEQLPHFISACILPLVNTATKDQANKLIKKGFNKFMTLFS